MRAVLATRLLATSLMAQQHSSLRTAVIRMDEEEMSRPEIVPVPLVTKSATGSLREGERSERLSEALHVPLRPGVDNPGRVLLIYTGGTLGMSKQNGSLAPTKGYLRQAIQRMPEVLDESIPEIDLLEYDPLVDSSNIAPEDWSRLASQIRDYYFDYDGFVIVHGTDTMAYTASALSYMLENLGKAVVLTGSMIPLAEVYNDARRNLLIATVFAAQLELCEVAIFFNDRCAAPRVPRPPPTKTSALSGRTEIALRSHRGRAR